MDILIKGLTLPEEGCTTINIHADGTVYVCESYPTELHEAVSVPPHGRLGDLDRLESNFRNMAKYQSGYRQQGILGCCETIRLAPTIIPASEGGKCGE